MVMVTHGDPWPKTMVTMETLTMEKTRVIDPITQWPCDPIRPVTMVTLWPMVTRDPGSLWPCKTRDPRPWYKGGGRYGVWRYIYGRNMVVPPHARRGQYGAWCGGPRIIWLNSSTTTFHPSTLYILIYPHNVSQISKSAKNAKIQKSQIFLFKKNACLQQDIYVY